MTRLIWLTLLAGCTASATTSTTSSTMPGPGPTAPALANTSIAAARPLAAGDAIDVTLPCGVRAYYGPVKFSAENQRLAVTSRVRTPTGKQVCGGGAFVDANDVVQGPAGTGCVDGSHDYAANLEYVYAPGAGNSNANPIYLSLWTSNGVGDPAAADCDVLALRVEVTSVP